MSHDQNNETLPVTIAPEETSSMPAGNQLTPIAGSNGFQQQIEFDLSQPLDLSITNVNGEIRVKASDEQTIWLVVRSNKGRQEDEINLTVSVDGNKVSIHPDWQLTSSLAGLARKIKDQLKNGLEPGDWNLSKLRFGDDFDYDIRVEVPRTLVEGSRVALRSTSGAINVDGLHTNVSVATASGAITANDLRGQVSMHSASGKVNASQISESLEINTASGAINVNGGEAWTALRSVSGGIRVENFVMKNAKIASVSGGIRANFIANNTAPYSFDTVSGSIELNTTFPVSNEGASLTFRSVSGSATLRGEWTSTGKRSWKIGEGTGAPFRMNTVSGSLNMNGKQDAAVIARIEPLPVNNRPDDEDNEEQDDRHREMHDMHREVHDMRREMHDRQREIRREMHDRQREMREHAHQHGGPQFDFDRDDINRAVNWAKEAARRFTQPIEPVEPVPPTPPVPPAPAASATPPPATPTPPAQPVQQSEPAVQQAQAPVTPPATQPAQPGNDATTRPEDEEALNVLEALERGDIDVEEALARIERAENPPA